MSVLQLAISYTNTYTEPIFSLSLQQRKALFKSGIALFVITASFYLYLAGSVVSQNLQREDILSTLEKENLLMQEAEHALIAEDGKSRSFIEANAAGKLNVFDVIKRTQNVAGISSLFY
ncbi:hypothetical protein HYT01_02155 [Candidatus Giovannonibacteria bacterium]|nr:hypothetical protein [Candidatus Giovannonibacteria bacterium]